MKFVEGRIKVGNMPWKLPFSGANLDGNIAKGFSSRSVLGTKLSC